MSDISKPGEGEIVSGRLPTPYVHPIYTDRTPTLSPFVIPGIAAGAFLMVEWGTLRWIDHAPTSVWLASTAIGLCVLTVIALKDWLNFKNRRYFPISLAGLLVTWIMLIGIGYYLDATSAHEVDPAVLNLQSQLATARREKDVAVIERDAAKKALENTGNPPPPAAPPTPPIEKLKADDAEARIDAWNGIETQMDDFIRIMGNGGQIVSGWKSDQTSLFNLVNTFRTNLMTSRNRLGTFVGSYPDFSDLKIIDQAVPGKLGSAIENLFQACQQLSGASTPAFYESSIGPYIGPVRRQIASVKQWAETAKNLARSSASEIAARQVSK